MHLYFEEKIKILFRVEHRVDSLRDKTRKSILLAELIEQSEYGIDEGNILRTLIRICNQKHEKNINSMEVEIGMLIFTYIYTNFNIFTQNKLFQKFYILFYFSPMFFRKSKN